MCGNFLCKEQHWCIDKQSNECDCGICNMIEKCCYNCVHYIDSGDGECTCVDPDDDIYVEASINLITRILNCNESVYGADGVEFEPLFDNEDLLF